MQIQDNQYEMNEEAILKERKVIEGHLNHAIQTNLSALKNPVHLEKFASRLQKSEPDISIKIAEHFFDRVEEINKNRELRAPLQQRLYEIAKEEIDLSLEKKKLPPELVKEREEINKKMEKLPGKYFPLEIC